MYLLSRTAQDDNIIYMPRQQRSNDVVTDIASRFFLAVSEHLEISSAELSRRLGYSNPSTVQAIKRRTALPDIARLSEHKNALRNGKGQMLNFHWVITGDGSPLLRPGTQARASSEKGNEADDIIISIRKLPPKKRAVLLRFLSEFR